MRLGRKATTEHLVVYLNQETTSNPPRFGLVVSKAVGNAVQRNLVKRRARSALVARVESIPFGSSLVLRAMPGLAALSWIDFCAELDLALTKLTNKAVSK